MVPGRRVRSFRGPSLQCSTSRSPGPISLGPRTRVLALLLLTRFAPSLRSLSLLIPPLVHSPRSLLFAHSARSLLSLVPVTPSLRPLPSHTPLFAHTEPTQCGTAPRPAANGWSPSRTTFTSARSTRREIRRWPTTRACSRALAATLLSVWGAANPGPTLRASRVRRRPRLPSELARPAWWRLILRFHRICGEMKP